MEIFVATGNRNKIREFSQIMPEHKFLMPEDMDIEFDFEETGSTYFENALGKALFLYRKTGKPAIGEDSGLSVPALGGEPGIYSSRYGAVNGHKLSDSARNSYLLEKMKDIKERSGFYVCSMVLVLGEFRFFAVQETMEGEIALEPAGSGGFGYDPLFFYAASGKTAAQMEQEEKNRLSHRGKAGAKMKIIIDSLKKEME